MSTTTSSSQRSTWLVAGLATASAILVYRLTGAVTGILFSLVPPTMNLWGVQWLLGWEFHVQLVLGLLVAMLCATWQHRCLAGRSARASYWALSVFILFAILPLRVEIRREPVSWDALLEDPPSATDAAPVSLKCKVIAGEDIRPQEIFDHRNVTEAAAQTSQIDKWYVVRLHLDSAGQARLGEITKAEIGKTLGFWIDGELLCVGKIHQPILSGVIYVSGNFSHEEAAMIAVGILANE